MSTALCRLAGCVETPIPIVLGLQTPGAVTDSGDSNDLSAVQVTTTAAGGVITSLSVFVRGVDALVANRLYQLAVYSDANGVPSALLVASASGTLIANAWNTLPVTAVALDPLTNYWLVYNTNGRSGTVNNTTYDLAAGKTRFSPVVTFGTWPTTFPLAGATDMRLTITATLGPR